MNAYVIGESIVRTLTNTHFRQDSGDYDIQIGTTNNTEKLESFFSIDNTTLLNVGGKNIFITSEEESLKDLSFELHTCENDQIRLKSIINNDLKKNYCNTHQLDQKDIFVINRTNNLYTFAFYRK